MRDFLYDCLVIISESFLFRTEIILSEFDLFYLFFDSRSPATARAAESAANARSELLSHTAAVTAAAEASVREMKMQMEKNRLADRELFIAKLRAREFELRLASKAELEAKLKEQEERMTRDADARLRQRESELASEYVLIAAFALFSSPCLQSIHRRRANVLFIFPRHFLAPSLPYHRRYEARLEQKLTKTESRFTRAHLQEMQARELELSVQHENHVKMRLAEQEKQQTKFMYERMSAKQKELDKAQNTDELQQKIADLEAKISDAYKVSNAGTELLIMRAKIEDLQKKLVEAESKFEKLQIVAKDELNGVHAKNFERLHATVEEYEEKMDKLNQRWQAREAEIAYRHMLELQKVWEGGGGK